MLASHNNVEHWATMICIDNSEWMRNGDYPSNRLEAQSDACKFICCAKTQSNPKNAVGILTMAGKGVRVLVTPTSRLRKMLAFMDGLNIGGEVNLAAGLQVAQLALKPRQNQKQQQRIILFAGSFGEEDEGKAEKLEALVAAVNNSDNSRIIHIPPGARDLSDVLFSSPLFAGNGFAEAITAATVAAKAWPDYDFGVDFNWDPDLALVLRASMEEEKARQEAAAKKAAEEAAKHEKGEAQSTSQYVIMTENFSARRSKTENKAADLMDDNDLLQQAIAMSMDVSSSSIATRDMEADFEALESSVQDRCDRMLADQSFVSSFLAKLTRLPGVDPNNTTVKDYLASMRGQPEQKGENKEQQEDKEQKEDKKL
ncbi:26S proteasome non-ATPase regulatory subunit 4 -like protein [Capsicum chinense]|nr:26S proteasome non-ATPase regulatory subunit 4 -like protein [Capsicum chinense]